MWLQVVSGARRYTSKTISSCAYLVPWHVPWPPVLSVTSHLLSVSPGLGLLTTWGLLRWVTKGNTLKAKVPRVPGRSVRFLKIQPQKLHSTNSATAPWPRVNPRASAKARTGDGTKAGTPRGMAHGLRRDLQKTNITHSSLSELVVLVLVTPTHPPVLSIILPSLRNLFFICTYFCHSVCYIPLQYDL